MAAGVAVPERIAALPRDEHDRPVPWFVARVDGRPDFRIIDAKKIPLAVGERRCWICGQPIDPTDRYAFVVGPVSLFSRCTSEPPAERRCALYALRECPFLSTPGRGRRPEGMPPGAWMAGAPVYENPGVVLLWLCDTYRVEGDGAGGIVIRLPVPASIVAYCEGQPAYRNQLDDAFAAAAGYARAELTGTGIAEDVIDTIVASTRRLLDDAVMRL